MHSSVSSRIREFVRRVGITNHRPCIEFHGDAGGLSRDGIVSNSLSLAPFSFCLDGIFELARRQDLYMAV